MLTYVTPLAGYGGYMWVIDTTSQYGKTFWLRDSTGNSTDQRIPLQIHCCIDLGYLEVLDLAITRYGLHLTIHKRLKLLL